jgi:hypothetical protein
MLKDVDDREKESARRKAERKWRNHDIEKRLKEESAKLPSEAELWQKDLEIAGTLSREKPDGRGSVIRAQTKFAKDIRAMLEEHKEHNRQRHILLYFISIRARRKKLLAEKLRRLEAREAQRVAAGQYQKRDLFA